MLWKTAPAVAVVADRGVRVVADVAAVPVRTDHVHVQALVSLVFRVELAVRQDRGVRRDVNRLVWWDPVVGVLDPLVARYRLRVQAAAVVFALPVDVVE